MKELTAIFRREAHRWDSTVILDCETVITDSKIAGEHPELLGAPGRTTIRATAEPGDLIAGLSYRFYGHWQTHPKYGPQFHCKTFVRCQPHGQAGVSVT